MAVQVIGVFLRSLNCLENGGPLLRPGSFNRQTAHLSSWGQLGVEVPMGKDILVEAQLVLEFFVLCEELYEVEVPVCVEVLH
jgi:hypothetical protein